ncbi:MAG: transcriptional regulator [Candidatus Sulfotelmatobacter sp.]
MNHPTETRLRIGTWCVNPASGEISRDGKTARVEARTMRLLLCLAEHRGEVVSIDDLLSQVWPDVTVTQDSVYQAVTSLRRLLGDDPRQPKYIATVPRLGYRMVATVSPWVDQRTDPQPDIRPHWQRRSRTAELVSDGLRARRFVSRSSCLLLSNFAARSRTTLTQPPLLRNHRIP